MKRFFKNFLLSVFILSAFSGCSENPAQSSSEEVIVTTTSPPVPTGTVTEAVVTIPPEEKLVEPADGTYVYDNAKILSQEDFNECNNYACWINQNLMLNTAVVTADKLEELSPEEYAEKCYNEIFDGLGSGIIVLINNDTNKDYIYKHGTPSLYITQQQEKETFFYATKSIVNGDYKSAILGLLSLAELCPEYIFDNGSLFIPSQASELEKTAEDNNITGFIITTNNITEKSNTQLAADFYNRYYKNDDNKGTMLFIDKNLSEVIIMGSNFPDENLNDIGELVKLKDYYGAVEKYFNLLETNPQTAETNETTTQTTTETTITSQ